MTTRGAARSEQDGGVPPYRLVATDLDGTLVRSDGTISARSRAALGLVERAGATLVLVTGRPPRWLAPVVEQTGHHGLAICANGGLVYDLHTERIVATHPLQPVAALAVVRALRAQVPGVAFAIERGRRYGREPAYRTRWPVPDDTLIGAAEDLLVEPVVKLLVRHEGYDADALLARARRVVGDTATLTHSSREGLLEISASGVSKASTLELLCIDRGIAAEEVLAFGDMPNDLPLLAWAGHSVAVAGAHPDVLDVVDEVTASNDEDGVAAVLERVFDG